MAIALTLLNAYGDATDASQYSATGGASVTTPPAGALILMAVHNSHGSDATLPTVFTTSLNPTMNVARHWKQIATIQRTGGFWRTTLFGAVATGHSLSGALTIDYSGVTQVSFVCHIVQCLGVDTSAIMGAPAASTPIIQAVTNQGSGTTGTVTLATYGDTDNRGFSCWYHNANEGTTADATGWAELADTGHATPARAGQCQWYTTAADTTCTATWATSTGWTGIAVELREGIAEIPQSMGLVAQS